MKESMADAALGKHLAQAQDKHVFLEVERVAREQQLLRKFSRPWLQGRLVGVLSTAERDLRIRALRQMPVDAYIRETIAPSEHPRRRAAPEVIRQLGLRILDEVNEGPLYLAEAEFLAPAPQRRVVFLAQNRRHQNGVWKPRQHLLACQLVRHYAAYSMPLITIMDTPGADASEEANRDNQAHSISRLITEITSLPVPTVGIILGNGYSGGAIPLASTHVLLATQDGVCNTIHPQGLSSIAYNYNLSWQECARYMGLSACELHRAGILDGVIAYSPLSADPPHALREAILSSLIAVEEHALELLRKETNHFFFDHYRRNILNYLHPDALFREEKQFGEEKTPTGRLNVFGSVYRFQRSLALRARLRTESKLRYSRLDESGLPEGELHKRLEAEQERHFQGWMAHPLELRYDQVLMRAAKRFLQAQEGIKRERNRLTRIFLGRPETTLKERRNQLCLEIALCLYNSWKADYRHHLRRLLHRLEERPPQSDIPALEQAHLLDLLHHSGVFFHFAPLARNLLLFDLLYDAILDHLPSLAEELRRTNEIPRQTLVSLLDQAFSAASDSAEHALEHAESPQQQEFFQFLVRLWHRVDRDRFMRQMSEWKRMAHPRLNETLFAVVAHFFTHLVPSYFASVQDHRAYEGRINPRRIGVKDFWNRLDLAYRDLQLQNLFNACKQRVIDPQAIIQEFFTDFQETDADLISADPVRFPGFRQAIERALSANVPPVGMVTGIARLRHNAQNHWMGVALSNVRFQAGAFDMASGERVCRLLALCAQRRIPVVLFVASGGMQTKEGAGALFSMAVLNERITRFIKEFNLPLICFGFRDCTGGAQASFVTHPLARTFYLSGAVIPFAGQRVVPSYLPADAIFANYLSRTPGSMDGLVRNPFDADLDDRMRAVDAQIPLPQESIPEAIARTLERRFHVVPETTIPDALLSPAFVHFSKISRVLIHARGATAVRLIEGVRAFGADFVLVQSDADMDSRAARLASELGQLVCLGGNTPQESYLNERSVVRIAHQERVDALHPGIGFLSENANFAQLCRRHGLNFIGPSADSMEQMGNKSNAIATVRKAGVAVVPGSQGVVADARHAAEVAERIGYPVLIKAAFGGGGRGMRVVSRAEEFAEAFSATSAEALSAFGSGDVYLERYLRDTRHLEAQILRDRDGHCCVLGLRDCSVQRNNQKLIEESGSPGLSAALREQLFSDAEAIAHAVRYVGAGTVEFIYDRERDELYFMEMNTRLQVEHPVTEFVSGVDIVREQLRIACGESIAALPREESGWAMEVRVNAERMVLREGAQPTLEPAPGRVTRLLLPQAEHVRILSAVDEGDQVPPFYDGLILQIVAHASTRERVIDRLRAYLREVIVEGIYTNLALMEAVLGDPVFQKGDFATSFLPEFLARSDPQVLLEQMNVRNPRGDQAVELSAIRIPNSEELKIPALRTAVFYAAPGPDDPLFVQAGQTIDAQHTLCLLEAMKTFDPLKLSDYKLLGEMFPASQRYVVVRCLAQSGQAVNEGEPLFIVRPLRAQETA